MAALIYSTVGKLQDAKRIARSIVEEKLAACVNILPGVESIYRWKGKIEEENECVLIAKTSDRNVSKVIKRIEEIHPYEVPDIVVLPLSDGLKSYIEYVEKETL
jgi:periplasmic divalent cation tolerance protein